MASISNDKNGFRRIQLVTDGKRKAIRLGKCTAKAASTICTHIEEILAANAAGQPIPVPTAQWLGGISGKLHGRLANAGIAAPRRSASRATIATFIDAFISERSDIKPFTTSNILQAKNHLLRYFGDRVMQDVTRADATAFQKDLMARGYAEATYRRCLGRARQLWRAAAKRELYTGENPFNGISTTVRGNLKRRRFIDRDTIDRAIAAAPDREWRLIIALARYGGLRTPSETVALQWQHINWDEGQITVPSPKTEHHAGMDYRVIPLFLELEPLLMQAFEQAEPGVPWVITRYRKTSANLRTQFLRILQRAGIPPWPKLFQNLRASRATELANQHPLNKAAYWMGHSVDISQEHYLSVTPADYDKARKPRVPNGGGINSHPPAPPLSLSLPPAGQTPQANMHSEKAAQKAAQLRAEMAGIDPQASTGLSDKSPILRAFSDVFISVQPYFIPPTGFEPVYAD